MREISDNLTWRKSSFSGGQGGDCVEVAELPDGGRAVRDSKDLAGPAEQQRIPGPVTNK